MIAYSKRMEAMAKSAGVIRSLFGAMNDPELISFSGGALARESLPVDILREIAEDVLRIETRGYEALSYGPVLGVADLREAIVTHLLEPKGVRARADEIMVVSGGLETMNLLCQVFIDPGDVILVESPTFVHCVEVFDMFQARLIPVAMDEDGMDPADLEAKIGLYSPKMIYVIPTFQNPTGRTLSLERRRQIARLGSQYDVLILEDDPYRDIRYSGEDLPPIKAFDESGHVVMANSFSKILSPGSRVGYVHAAPQIISRLFDAKTATNSHTSLLPQILFAEFFKRGYYPEHHKRLCDIHREKRDAMIDAIDRYFPQGTQRTFPDGGLFTWAQLPGGLNATTLLQEAITDPAVKVAYVAGEGFFSEGGGKGSDCMRLSFGGPSPAQIYTGIEKLGNLLKSKL